jgi:hypothetical protein
MRVECDARTYTLLPIVEFAKHSTARRSREQFPPPSGPVPLAML